MSLQRVEIIGFKSFMNQVVLEFRDGITAIIGPNGCGKTNIVDAIRWVLGEQSAKQLRGAKMENVIFNGTELHKPMGYAEVSLTINNEKGNFPLDYSEIKITRKVYRSGISEYFINKSQCRLKDIKELFADTGTGSHSYAAIEQDMIDDVLNDAHGERRLMFEEAAGIVKYRMRREEAQRKLKLTENDLVRLEDIIEELKKQVGSLRYQVGKAKRYERISRRIRDLELILLRKELSSLLGEKRETERELDNVLRVAESEDFSLSELESELERKRDQLSEMESQYNELQNNRYEIRRKIQGSEEKIIQSKERKSEASRRIEKAKVEIEEAHGRLADIEQRLEVLSSEIDSIRSEIEKRESEVEQDSILKRDLSQKIDQMKSRLIEAKQTQLDFLHDQMKIKSSLEHYESVLEGLDKRTSEVREEILAAEGDAKSLREAVAEAELGISKIREELRNVENNRNEVRSRLSSLSEDIASKSASISEKREKLAHERSRYEMLKGMLENLEGYSLGTRFLLERGGIHVKGPLADLLKVEEKYMPSVVATLNVLLDSVIIEEIGAAKKLLGSIKEEGIKSARVIFSPGALESYGGEVKWPGLLGKLKDFVRLEGASDEFLERLLGKVLLFEDIDSAFSFIERADEPYDVVTMDGIYIGRCGSIYYGREDKEDISLIGRRERLKELEETISSLASQLESLDMEIDQLRNEKGRLEAESSELDSGLEYLRGQLSRKVDELKEVEKNHIMKKEKVSMLLSTLDELENSRAEILAKIEETRMAFEMQEATGGETGAEDLEAELNEVQKEKEGIDARLTEKKLALASLKGEYEKKLQEQKGIIEMQGQFRELVSQRQTEMERSKEEINELSARLEEERANVSILDDEERSCKARIDSLYSEIEGVREEISRIEGELKRKKNERDEIFERQNQYRIRKTSVETRMRDLIDRARDMYSEDLSCYLEGMEIPLSEEDMKITHEDLEREKKKLASLGPVNLAAVDEYAERKERLEFLVSQKADLEKAKEELNEAIRKINRRARKLFLETFEKIRKNFSETFRILFEGGEADLVLGEAKDPLEADIVISARPKGKRLQDISLLSGGERALTALALLFALYKTKPSPFCILDEVDAQLDDANVKRFVKMLESFKRDTQFIIITHNKRTMEIAETLYGVTMEEKGVSKVVSVDMTEVEDILKNKTKANPLIDTAISTN